MTSAHAWGFVFGWLACSGCLTVCLWLGYWPASRNMPSTGEDDAADLVQCQGMLPADALASDPWSIHVYPPDTHPAREARQ